MVFPLKDHWINGPTWTSRETFSAPPPQKKRQNSCRAPSSEALKDLVLLMLSMQPIQTFHVDCVYHEHQMECQWNMEPLDRLSWDSSQKSRHFDISTCSQKVWYLEGGNMETLCVFFCIEKNQQKKCSYFQLKKTWICFTKIYRL